MTIASKDTIADSDLSVKVASNIKTEQSLKNKFAGQSMSDKTFGIQTELLRAIKTADVDWIKANGNLIRETNWNWEAHNPLKYCIIKGSSKTFAILAEIFKEKVDIDKTELMRNFILKSRHLDYLEGKDPEKIVVNFVRITKILGIDPLLEENTVLHLACEANRIDIIKWLIHEKRRDFYKLMIERKTDEQTPIMICAKVGANQSLDLILRVSCKKKEIIDKKGKSGFTAMHNAAFQGFAEIVKILLDNGASVTRKNNRSHNALRTAINCRKTEVIKVILDSQDWEQALYFGTDFGKTGKTAHESLINDFPTLAEIVMDKSCYHYKDLDTQKERLVFDVKFHEDFFGEKESEVSKSSLTHCSVERVLAQKQKKFGMAHNNPITAMMHRNHENLFTHPLALIHFRHEFRNYGILHYLYRFTFLLAFNISFNKFLCNQPNPVSNYLVGGNKTVCELYNDEDQCGWEHWKCFCPLHVDSEPREIDRLNDAYPSNNSYWRTVLLVLFLFRIFYFFCFYEVVQLLHVWKWIRDEELREKVIISITEMALIILAMRVVFCNGGPNDGEAQFISCFSWQLGIFIFPFLLIQLLFLSKNFLFMLPKIGKYVLVFYGVFLRTIMILGMVLIPIYGFIYSFHGMFRARPDFQNMYRSVFKTISMLFGEFELDGVLWDGDGKTKDPRPIVPFPHVSLSLIYLFMIVMCVVS